VAKIEVARDQRHVEVHCEFPVASLEHAGLARKQGRRTKIDVPTDLRMQLAYVGITGVKFILIDYFPVHRHPLPPLPFEAPENYVPAVPSTLKSIEDSLLQAANRMPDLAEDMSRVLATVNVLLDDVSDKELPGKARATLDEAHATLRDLRERVRGLETAKISSKAQRALERLDATVARVDRMVERADSDRGLVASVQRASEALGEAARNANGVGPELEETLSSVKDAAKSIRRLADALERDPDMLLKGRAKAASR
jgi:phospholipid/cholesterol/gamma-HCH transport system substrate-binding protein